MPELQRVPEAHVQYAYGIYLLAPKHRLIKALKKRYKPSIHGHRTWGSSFIVMDYLAHNGLRRGSSVLEVGCGWGGISVYCARAFKAKVTAADLDEAVFPYVKVLADLNDVAITPRQIDFTKLKKRDLANYRYIVASDICFWDSLVKPLARLVDRAISAGVNRIIIADPGRPTFYEFCELVGAKHKTRLCEWYAIEPERFEGEVVEIRPKTKS